MTSAEEIHIENLKEIIRLHELHKQNPNRKIISAIDEFEWEQQRIRSQAILKAIQKNKENGL